MTKQTATVETLTAEVRVLVVGNRQVTLSVYRQLDNIDPEWFEPFGRVCDSQDRSAWPCRRCDQKVAVVRLVGVDTMAGALSRVRAFEPVRCRRPRSDAAIWCVPFGMDEYTDDDRERFLLWDHLPLIILAGLR